MIPVTIKPPPAKLIQHTNIPSFTSSINSISSSKSKSKIAEMGFEEIEDDDDHGEN